jgi:hypothetical protein
MQNFVLRKVKTAEAEVLFPIKNITKNSRSFL